MSFQSPKGTKDVLPEEQPYWERVETAARRIARLYGYERIDLPVFEDTGLYKRGVGAGTDIVEKEMYTFEDKGGSSITLRPEFTAGVMRAYLENGLASRPKPVKVWSIGPVFRYERPQAGRFRQHTQFNVEAIGESDPALDFEIMSVAFHLYEELGFRDLSFQINSIGCPKCRPAYLEKLSGYFSSRKADLCSDCGQRLVRNPLRLLDCKNPACQAGIAAAPAISDSLCGECESHFRTLRSFLDDRKRPVTVNHRLVRGLDYYTKTVFEVWAEGIGSQNAVCGGGRYDGLAEAIGGPATPGVGFASGIERIVLTLKQQAAADQAPSRPRPAVYFAHLGAEAGRQAVALAAECRAAGIETVMGFGERSLKAQMREANTRGAVRVAVIGESEIAARVVQLKSMEDGGQSSVPWAELTAILKAGEAGA
ncbi:histidine--tRNA ligase [bacterium]|nr:histidine--tRNA ligase [bacterium]